MNTEPASDKGNIDIHKSIPLDLASELIRIVNDGSLKREIHEASNFDSDLSA